MLTKEERTRLRRKCDPEGAEKWGEMHNERETPDVREQLRDSLDTIDEMEFRLCQFKQALKAFIIPKMKEVPAGPDRIDGYTLHLDNEELTNLFELIDRPEGAPPEPKLFVEKKA